MIKEGDIGFVHNGAVISHLISWAMGSKWSHSFVVIGEVHGVVMVVETSDFEVTIGPLSRYTDGRPLSIYRIDGLSEEDVSTVCKRGLSLLGVKYGHAQLLSLGIRRLLRKIGINIGNFIRSGLVCCAVPLYAYEFILGIDPESIDTEDLYQKGKNSFTLVETILKNDVINEKNIT